VALFSLLGLGEVGLVLRDAGYGVASLLSLGRLAEVAHRLSVLRYTGSYRSSLVTQAFLAFVYAAPALAGLVAASAPATRTKWLYGLLLPFLSPALLMLIRTQRGAVIVSAILWVSEYFAAAVMMGERTLVTGRRVALAATVLGLALLLFAYVAVLRNGATEVSLAFALLPKVVTGAFGGPINLSIWLRETRGVVASPALGAYTFSGVYDILGLHTRVLGLFDDFHTLQSGYSTNIYTIFRPLIEDFTLPGALLLSSLFGFLAQRSYDGVRRGRPRAAPGLAAAYATILFSFNTCIWTWNATIAAVLLLGAFVQLAPRESHVRRRIRSRDRVGGQGFACHLGDGW